MRILLVTGDLPGWSHGVRASNLVLASLMDEILAAGHEIILQFIGRNALPENHAESRKQMEERGITVLPWMTNADYRSTSLPSKIHRAIDRRLLNQRFFYPACALAPEMERRVTQHKPDCALLFWVPEAVAITSTLSIPRFAYYGMPDHAARSAQLSAPELFSLTATDVQREQRKMIAWKKEHLKLMRDCTVVADLCADHAKWYKDHGHPDAVYVQNLWPMTSTQPVDHHALQGKRLKISANMGRPAATGNTFGLHFLATEILPQLDSMLGKDQYEMHLFGHGEPFPYIKKELDHPAVRMRGWVNDIDAEVRDCQIFLVANSALPHYQGSHTRFLHAWTMQACCIGHTYNTLANPEMIHDHNILLGNTGAEIATQIVRAAKDPDLRARIGDAGFKAYQESFTPHIVARSLLAHLERISSSSRSR